MMRNPKIEFAREDDDRWIAEARVLPGVLAYDLTREEAQAKVEDLARRSLREQKSAD